MAPTLNYPHRLLKAFAVVFSAGLAAYIYKMSQLNHVQFIWSDYPFLQFWRTVLGFIFILVFLNIALKNVLLSYSRVTLQISRHSELCLLLLVGICATLKTSFHSFVVILLGLLVVSVGIGIVHKVINNTKSEFSKNLFFASLLSVFNLLFLKPFSPLNTDIIFFSMTGRLDALQPFESQFRTNSSLGELLGTLDQTSNLGGLPYYPFSQSELFNWVAFLFNVDGSNSIEIFNVFKFIVFVLFSLGMVGAFFMLRTGFGLSAVTSFIGSIIYFYGNSAYIGYLGNENYHHLSEYVVFPWSVLCITFGLGDPRKKTLLILGGFILGCASYLMRSAFEFTAISCLSLFLFAAFISYFTRPSLRATRLVLTDIFKVIFYIAIGFALGSSLFIATLIGNLYESNIAIIQPHDFFGLPWKYPLVEWESIIFKFKFSSEYPRAPDDVGQHVGFFKGPVVSFLIAYSFFSALRRYFNGTERELALRTLVVFVFLFMFLVFIQLGENSPVSYLMTYFSFGRVHFSSRLLVYFHLFVGIATAFIFEDLIIKKRLDTAALGFCFIFYVLADLIVQLPKHTYDYVIYELGLLLIFAALFQVYFSRSKAYALWLFPIVFFLNCYYQSDFTQRVLNNNKSFEDFHFSLPVSPNKQELAFGDAALSGCRKIDEQCAQEIKKEIIQLRLLNTEIHAKCMQDISGIDRFSINPLCQELNSPIRKIVGANHDRHLYIFSKDLPQFSNGLNGIDVSDMSVYTYGGSPVFPNIRATQFLWALYGLHKPLLTIPYKFDPNRLLEIKTRRLINVIGIRFLIIEASDTNKRLLGVLREHFELIYDDNELYILLNRDARPFTYPASATVHPPADTGRLVKTYPFFLSESTPRESISHINESENVIREAFAGLKSKSDVIIDDDFTDRQKPAFSPHDSVEVSSMAGTRLSMKVNCSERCLFVVNNVMLRGWSAFSSKGPLRLFSVNLGLIGVEIPSAYSGFVYLEYSDIYREIGLFALFSSLLLILFGLGRHTAMKGDGPKIQEVR